MLRLLLTFIVGIYLPSCKTTEFASSETVSEKENIGSSSFDERQNDPNEEDGIPTEDGDYPDEDIQVDDQYPDQSIPKPADSKPRRSPARRPSAPSGHAGEQV